MLLLFLDLETSGLNSYTDQVIEIAGVIVDLNKQDFSYKIVSQFDDLVRLRQKLDDKITRITGLTDLELETAKNLNQVQQNWFDWLSPYEKELSVIVGHSVNFDLGFLKNENWFLPENYKVIDTLDLAKIIFPHFSAVNLEFLIAKLDIVITESSDKKMLPHRAGFDTLCCVELFKKVLSNLQDFNYPKEFHTYLQKYFLPLDLNFFDTKKAPLEVEVIDSNQNLKVFKIDFSGQEISPSISIRINQLGSLKIVDSLNQVLGFELPLHLSLVVAQLYVINFLQISNRDWHYKFHAQGKNGFKLLQIILNIVSPDSGSLENDDSTKVVLGQFENIITQIRFLTEIEHNTTNLVDYLEIYRDIYSLIKPTDKAILEIQKILSSYDFLLFNLQSFWQNNEYNYNPRQSFPEEKIIQNKFIEFCELLKNLQNFSFSAENILLAELKFKIVQALENMVSLDPKQNYIFRFFNSVLTINESKVDFDLSKYLASSWKQFSSLEIQTYLNPEDFELLISLAGLKKLFEDQKIEIKFLHESENKIDLPNKTLPRDNSIEIPTLVDFYREKLELAKTTNKPVIILCGQNSTLRDSQRVLTGSFEVKDYLLLGESGSLTKVGSKLVRNFVGLAVVKMNDFNYLLKLSDLPEFEEIWIVNQPFLWVQKYWQNLSKQSSEPEYYLSSLKRLYVQSQANYFSSMTGKQVNFLRAYK